jgi:Tfp pilus assembly protein PilV
MRECMRRIRSLSSATDGLKKSIGREDGFSLTELMVTLGILVIFLIGIGGMITSGVKSSTSAYNLVKMSEGASEGMSTMVRQIRVAASLDPACTTSAIVFTGDVNGDDVENTVRFDAAGGYLRRGSSADNMSDWIPNVEAVTFTYYYINPVSKKLEVLSPGTGDWTNFSAQVRRIDIALSMSSSAVGAAIDRDFSSSVNLRNSLR